MQLSDMMLAYRASASISQKEAARRANITLQTWHNIETKSQSPSRLTEAKIRKLFETKKEGK